MWKQIKSRGEILNLHVLDYADDAALMESRIKEMTERLTQLADASESEADMQVRMDKTFTAATSRNINH